MRHVDYIQFRAFANGCFLEVVRREDVGIRGNGFDALFCNVVGIGAVARVVVDGFAVACDGKVSAGADAGHANYARSDAIDVNRD